MNSKQRSTHLYVWLILLVIVPTIMLLAIKDLNVFHTSENNTAHITSSKPDALKSAENDLIKVSLYSQGVEIILKSTLKSSSAVVYELNQNEEKGDVIGQISTVGIYNFNATTSLKGIVIIDALKETEITKLIF